MSGVLAAITSGSMITARAKASAHVDDLSFVSNQALKASDSPATFFINKISGIDSNNLISPDFNFVYESDLIIDDNDYDAIGEGNMAVLMTKYPPESFRSDDETGYDAYNPVQGFSVDYPYITSVVPNPDEGYTDFSDYDRIIFMQHHSLEADSLKTKLGTGEIDTSTENATDDAMNTIISQLAEQLYNTNITSDYVSKTISIPQLTARDFLQEGTEAAPASTSTSPGAASSAPVTSGGSY